MPDAPITPTPLPEGYTARPGSLDDAPVFADLMNAYWEPLVELRPHPPDEKRARFGVPGFDPATSTRLVFGPGGDPAGCITVFDTDDPPVHPHIIGAVSPDHMRRGIGTHLVTWALQRSQQAIARVPEGIRVSAEMWFVDAHEPTRRLAEGLGFTPGAYSLIMNINLDQEPPPPVWPDGITLRTFREMPDLRALYLAEHDAFRDHRGFVEGDTEERLARWQHFIENDPYFDPDLWFLAMDGDEIAGVAVCESHTGDDMSIGLVDTLGVRRPWRRRGLGLALLLHSFHELRGRGKAIATLGVDAQSLTGATRLYEKAGMYVYRRMAMYERELRGGEEISTQAL